MPLKPEEKRADRLAVCGLALLVLLLFSGNLVTRTYPIDPFWVETAFVHMPLKTFFNHCISIGRLPTWNPHVAFGYPMIAHTHSFFFYPPAWVFYVLKFLPAMVIYLIFHLMLIAITSYRLIRFTGGRPEGSFLAAASLTFGGYVASNMGFPPVISTFAWAPPAIYLVARLMRERRFVFVLALGAVTAVQFLAGDLETLFYQWIFIALGMLLFRIYLKEEWQGGWNPVFAIAMALGLGLVLMSVQFIPLVELLRKSDRLSGWASPPLSGKYLSVLKEYLMWAVRFALPAPTLGHSFNFGIPALLFGAIGWWKSDWNRRWMIALLFAFCFVAAVPFFSPLQRVLAHLPVLKGFRFPWRLMFFLNLVICVSAAPGVDRFLAGISESRRLPTYLPIGAIIYGLCYLLIVLVTNKSLIGATSVLIVAGITTIIAVSGRTINRKLALGILAALFLSDLFVKSWLALPRNHADVMDAYPEVARLFQENRSGPNAWSRSIMFPRKLDSHFLGGMEAAWGGYSPAFPYSISLMRWAKYLSLMVPHSFEFDKETDALLGFRQFNLYFFKHDFLDEGAMPWFDLSGIRYVIVKKGDVLKFRTSPLLDINAYFQKNSKDNVDIYVNPKVFPRAFLATRAKIFSNYREVFRFMNENPALDYGNTALLESRTIEPVLVEGSSGTIPLIERYLPDEVDITVDSKMPSYLVLTDTYYPGWRAFVDDKETKIIPSDGAFRAVWTPEGKHKVIFSYQPISIKIGLWTTLVVGLWNLAYLFFIRRRNF